MSCSAATPAAELWQEIAAKKRAEVASKIPPEWRLLPSYLDKVSPTSTWNVLAVPRECGILSQDEIHITEGHDAVSLVEAIAAGTYTALQVATAFCKRAAIAQQLIIFEDALSRARDLDAYFAETGKVKGPFHGLPISLKSAESENNVFGRVLNPHKLSLGAGGSSGGEGALVAMRGSLLGVGTDIAGSIRIPALCCGVFGFKPTASRVPYGGQGSGSRPGNPGILASAGPLATSARDLRFFLENIIRAKPWDCDPTAFFLPFRDPERHSKLKLGYFRGDPSYPLHPPVARALGAAVEQLRKSGHSVEVLDQLPDLSKAVNLAFKYFDLDTAKTSFGYIAAGGEPKIASLKTSSPEPSKEPLNLDDLFAMNTARAQIIAEWQNIWLENHLDAIIMPGHRSTAVQHDKYGQPPYTVLWNLVDVTYPRPVLSNH
ncbi:hypothetical protein DV737_g1991, partial [Chaetothyriales sp. CBS 132003]